MPIGRIVVVALLIAVAGVVPQAKAQSQYCLPLQMELAELEKYAPSSRSNDRALRRDLDRARDEARRAGCRGGFFLFGNRSRSCRSVLGRISRLERELSGSRPRGLFNFGNSAAERRRDRVRQALRRNGCTQFANTFRTICVRVCDGYYFPLSFAASAQRFESDARKCLSQYGPGEAELYYHPNPGGDASQAVSLTGERYFDLPYAFTYRTSFQPQCAAKLHEGLAMLATRVVPIEATPGVQFEAAVTRRMAATSVPIPIARADLSSDPETLANRAGDLVPTAILRREPTPAIASGDMRTIGDPYLFAEANPGPPATVAGYKPPELRDFRVPLKASALPVAR